MDAKSAVTAAIQHVQPLFGQVDDLRLEEVEKDDRGWKVTVSWSRGTTTMPGNLGSIFPPQDLRVTKVIAIDGVGQLLSVKMRA